ncbi:glycogen synthase GlgA [Cohnella lubricantis]|uniref:Glycogen synthase n=1 Tax=Cohnella lubricantis TaxID=2163172 RepID=A0A841T4F1_9BACL|nr:glycogen synthase GlgA [Cohnella lubricantis]MBB6676443.1 glycogen synthase GlgA [Cohnella lubricantis]MBP2117550.1 starch synthase [Cohnella lubricantis]
MKVWFAASEAAPLVKSGGLADVVGALPKALAKRGIDVTVVLPKYGAIPSAIADEAADKGSFDVTLGWRTQYCGLLETFVDGVRFLLVDNEYFFKRGYLYGYGDEEAERFAFFGFAAIEALFRLGKDELPDILHCHDWQTGLVPMLLRTRYSHIPAFKRIRTVFTIHNLQYQGVFSRDQLKDLLSAGDELFTEDGMAFYGAASCMKAGLRYADKLTTVSPAYAQEIQTPEYGEKLDGVLRQRAGDLKGIVNGIDTDVYDPMRDPHLAVNYRFSLLKKRRNKKALQEEFGLPADERIPMIGVVSRIVEQKGFDLILEALPGLMAESIQLVILGSGDLQLERKLYEASVRHKEKLFVWFGFNEGLARRIYAGSDMFLMPSRFEPCGLSQLIALQYRTVPIVRETGGLRDTVQPYNEFTGEGTGFSFGPASAHDLLFTVRRALAFYKDEAAWERIVDNGAKRDVGWEASAREYEKLYQELVHTEGE